MASRVVIIAGATGLVGKEILEGLLADNSVAMVHCLGRRAPTIQHAKLVYHIVDFAELPALPPANEAYLALGTTIKTAGSQEAFRAIDLDASLAVAKAALMAGVTKVGLVSAMGADHRSMIFYSRVKGELEHALSQMPFEGLVIARPSMLVGNRETIGQPIRRGEVLASMLGGIFNALIPANYKPVKAVAVAKTLLATVPVAQGKLILLSGSMGQFKQR